MSHVLRALVDESQPVVLTGGCIRHWPALRFWSHDYLRGKLGDTPIHVALTPDGLGDAVVLLPDGEPCFARPHEAYMPFSQFVGAIERPLCDVKTGAQTRAVAHTRFCVLLGAVAWYSVAEHAVHATHASSLR